MAQFSFTISASDMNTIKGNTGNSATEITVDRGLQRKTKHRILTAKFGDGYEQRVKDGINSKEDMFNVSFNNRSAEDIALISGFFDEKAGKNFTFTVTDRYSSGSLTTSDIKVVVDDYDITYGQADTHSLTAQLRRVYEP